MNNHSNNFEFETAVLSWWNRTKSCQYSNVNPRHPLASSLSAVQVLRDQMASRRRQKLFAQRGETNDGDEMNLSEERQRLTAPRCVAKLSRSQ